MNENDYTILPCPCCGAKAEFQQLGDEDGGIQLNGTIRLEVVKNSDEREIKEIGGSDA